jgi:hypothetical protein
MNVKQVIDRHPVLSALGLVFTIVSTTLGIVLPLTGQSRDNLAASYEARLARAERRYQADLLPLQQSLSSIQRAMGPDTEYLDVGAITVDSEEAHGLAQVQLFPGDKFYGLPDELLAGWTYGTTTELQLLSDVTGEPPEVVLFELAPMGVTEELLTARPVHLWRGPQAHVVEGIPGLRNLYSQVLVQRASHDDVRRFLGVPSPSGPLDVPTESDEALAALDRFYQGDSTGLWLLLQLEIEVASTGNEQTELESIQKKGNLVYARFETTFSDIVVDGELYPQYFWTRELVLISTPEDLFMVKTSIPTADQTSEDFAWMTRWFQAFHVLSDF